MHGLKPDLTFRLSDALFDAHVLGVEVDQVPLEVFLLLVGDQGTRKHVHHVQFLIHGLGLGLEVFEEVLLISDHSLGLQVVYHVVLRVHCLRQLFFQPFNQPNLFLRLQAAHGVADVVDVFQLAYQVQTYR